MYQSCQKWEGHKQLCPCQGCLSNPCFNSSSKEHHLQRAISGQQVYGDTQQLVIPTPESEEVDGPSSNALYKDGFKQPKQYIHVQGASTYNTEEEKLEIWNHTSPIIYCSLEANVQTAGDYVCSSWRCGVTRWNHWEGGDLKLGCKHQISISAWLLFFLNLILWSLLLCEYSKLPVMIHTTWRTCLLFKDVLCHSFEFHLWFDPVVRIFPSLLGNRILFYRNYQIITSVQLLSPPYCIEAKWIWMDSSVFRSDDKLSCFSQPWILMKIYLIMIWILRMRNG